MACVIGGLDLTANIAKQTYIDSRNEELYREFDLIELKDIVLKIDAATDIVKTEFKKQMARDSR